MDREPEIGVIEVGSVSLIEIRGIRVGRVRLRAGLAGIPVDFANFRGPLVRIDHEMQVRATAVGRGRKLASPGLQT